MGKLKALLLTGCLALAAPSAFAIPLQVDIIGGTGSWSLTGPTSTGDDWFGAYSNEFDILPGVYSWSISGLGLGFAGWSLTLDNDVIHYDYDAGLVFEISDDHRFTAVTQVPEPAMLSLLGIALMGLGFSIRRKSLQA